MQLMTVSRAEAEKVYIVVQATDVAGGLQAGGLYPGQCVEWVSSTTDAWQGYVVQKVIAGSLNTTDGLSGAKVAGVVDTTISTGEVGRLQVYGPANVRASASIDGPVMVVTYSINATNIGHVTTGVNTTLFSPKYLEGIVGWTLEDGPNATNSTVQLYLL